MFLVWLIFIPCSINICLSKELLIFKVFHSLKVLQEKPPWKRPRVDGPGPKIPRCNPSDLSGNLRSTWCLAALETFWRCYPSILHTYIYKYLVCTIPIDMDAIWCDPPFFFGTVLGLEITLDGSLKWCRQWQNSLVYGIRRLSVSKPPDLLKFTKWMWAAEVIWVQAPKTAPLKLDQIGHWHFFPVVFSQWEKNCPQNQSLHHWTWTFWTESHEGFLQMIFPFSNQVDFFRNRFFSKKQRFSKKFQSFSFLNFQDQLPSHLHQHFTATAPRDGAAPRFLPRFDVTNSSNAPQPAQPLEPVNLKLGGWNVNFKRLGGF